MKLHLPKMLRAALIAAVCTTSAYAGSLTFTTNSDGDTLWDVGYGVKFDDNGNPIGLSDNYKIHNDFETFDATKDGVSGYVDGEKVFLLDGNDRLGIYDANGLICNNPVSGDKLMGSLVGSEYLSIFGSGVWNWDTDTYSQDRVFSNSLKVTGTLYIKDTAKVALGGQYKVSKSSTYDYYMGLTADTVIVDGTTPTGDNDYVHLEATTATIGTLSVKSGNVHLHHDISYNSGNSNGNSDNSSKKMVEITKELNVEGGNVYIGRNGPSDSASDLKKHYINSLKGKINQSGGNLIITGKTVLGANITQTGGSLSLADGSFIKISTNPTSIVQSSPEDSTSGNNAKMVLGQITALNMLSKVTYSQLNILQTSNGEIHLKNGVTFTTKNASTASSITQTGGGKVNLTGNFTSAIFNVDVTKGLLTLTNSSTKLKSNELSVGSGSVTKNGDDVSVEGAFVDNNGIMTVGTGTGGSKAGGLYVTTGGTLNATLDGDKAALHVVSSTRDYGITAWAMSEGSVFGIGLTDDCLSKNATATQGSDSTYTLVFENVLVAEGAVELTDLKNSFCLGNMDDRLWSLAENSATWSQSEDKSKTYVNGTLVFDSTIEITEGGVESNSFSDVTDKNDQELPVNLAISEKDVTLSGDNDYSGTTSIDGVTVTLDHENALGKSRSITTRGEAGLATTEGVTANLSSTITIEEGDGNTLSIEGSYKADDSITLAQKEQAEAWFDAKGGTGNGFYRAASTEAYEVVKGVTDDNLTVNALDDVLVTIGDKEYQLYSDGLAGEKLDYSTYAIKGKHEVSVSEILAANDTDTATEKVVMEHADGMLTADAGIEVQSTAGTLVTTGEETIVTGSLKDTAITAEGGEIAADISGTSAITATSGTTTLSGDNSYTGGTIVDTAELIVTQNGGLGSGDVVLQGHGTLDLGNKAISNNILVKGCTLRGAAAYTGDMVVEDALELVGNTTAGSVTLTKKGSLSGGPLTTSTLDVQTGGSTSVGGDLTILNGGRIILSNGSVLDVSGSLTLAGATTLELNGAYSAGTTLASASTLTTGAITLIYSDPTLELEQIGNTLVLVSKFKQDKADALAQGNWGIVTASRAFVNTVRGQRNNTGCIANGKGTAWFSLLGASNNLKGGDVSVDGAAVGADMQVGKRSVLGVAFGYTDGTVSPTGLRKVEQDGYYAAIYGEHGLRKLSNNSCLSFDWVAAYGTTESRQGALNWEQDSLQLNARVNWNKQINNRLGVTAFAGVEYFADESAEAEGAGSGSIQNLRGELGVGVSYVAWGAAAQEAGTSGCRNLVLHGELRYFNDMVRSNPVVEMSGIRGMGTNPGRQGFGVEAGATFRINERWTTSANYSFDAMEDSQEHRVNVGASYSF